MGITYQNFRNRKDKKYKMFAGSPIAYTESTAQVDEVRKTFFRKPTTVSRDIYKEDDSAQWIFVDTGEYCPYSISKLERSHYAQQKMKEI